MKKKIIVTLLIATTVMAQSLTAFAAPERVPDGGYLDPDWYLSAYPELTTPEYTSKYPELANAIAEENPENKACWLYQYHKKYGKDEGRVRVDNGITTPTGNPGQRFDSVRGDKALLLITPESAVESVHSAVTEVMPETETAPGVTVKIYDNHVADRYTPYTERVTVTKNLNMPAPAVLTEDVIIAPGCGYPALESVKALHGQAFPRALCDQIQAYDSSAGQRFGCENYAQYMQDIAYGRLEGHDAEYYISGEGGAKIYLHGDDRKYFFENASQIWTRWSDGPIAAEEINCTTCATGSPYTTWCETLPEVQKYDIIGYTHETAIHYALVLYVDKANNRVLTTDGGGGNSGCSTGLWVPISQIGTIHRPSNAFTVTKELTWE